MERMNETLDLKLNELSANTAEVTGTAGMVNTAEMAESPTAAEQSGTEQSGTGLDALVCGTDVPQGTVVMAATPIGNTADASARLIALLERADIDSHATGAQNAQLFVHTPVGLAQRHEFDLPQSGDESTEATPHPRDGLSEPNEVQLISLLQNSADPPRMQPSRTSSEMKPPYHYSKGTRRSIKATTRKTQTPPKRDDARLHETELRPVCWTLLIRIQP